MIVLVNFNDYLGGGETLFVRLAEYLQSCNKEFLLAFRKGSYIESDLANRHIGNEHLIPLSGPLDYYYLTKKKREALCRQFSSFLEPDRDYAIYPFCARDLYFVVDLTKILSYNIKLIHLVLHEQDNLYCCQTLCDKIKLILFKKRLFSSQKMIEFNKNLFNQICDYGVVIPQSDWIVKLWSEKYDIHLSLDAVVPLPTCSFPDYAFNRENNKKILWIGRIVPSKIPSLCVLLDFLSRRKDYSLTIVGYGEEFFINDYIKSISLNKEQVRFLGKVEYSKLGAIIQEHSIGYAMGTSIIEIAQFGLPVILALASPDFRLFSRDICGGLYVNQTKGDVGSSLYYNANETDLPLIDDTINKIEFDYKGSARASYNYIKNIFDFQKNAEAYFELGDKFGTYHRYDVKIPYASVVRRLAFRLFSH